jgi:DNA-binding response OmpR family regulator
MNETGEPAAVLLVSGDLMASSWIRPPAVEANAKVDVAVSINAALKMAESKRYSLAIVDLGLAGQQIRELVEGLRRSDPSQRIFAYGPHVQDHVLQAAEAAGCDRVLTRGQLHSQIARIIADAAGLG